MAGIIAGALLSSAFVLGGGTPAEALDLTPNVLTDEDDGSCDATDCTLREAVIAANKSAEDDVIHLDGQTHKLSIFNDLLVDPALFGGSGKITFQGPGTIQGFHGRRILSIAEGAEVVIDRVTLTGANSCPVIPQNCTDGGAIFNQGTLALSSSTVSGNTGNAGGAIRNSTSGDLTVTSSTISGNTSKQQGGALSNSGEAAIISSTISGNQASNSDGGGIRSAGTLTVVSSTITRNKTIGVEPGFGGGIRVTGTATFEASIVAGNTPQEGTPGSDPECSGSVGSRGYNVVGNIDDSCSGFTATGDLVDADPQLGPLQNNGGPTKTHAIDDTSPAYNRQPGDDPDCPATDQRGVARAQFDDCDSGAFEFDPPVGIPSGVNALVQAIADANGNNQDDVIDLGRFTFTLTEVNNHSVGGANGLPVIGADNSHELTIRNGTITRSSEDGTPSFRLLEVGPDARLTLVGVTLSGGKVDATTTTNRGGAVRNLGTLNLDGSTVSGNSATGGGAGIWNLSELNVVDDSSIFTNVADGSGGGIFNSAGNVTVTGSTIATNVGGGTGGGGIFTQDGSVNLAQADISGNSAPFGAGLFADAASLIISASSISDNPAASSGGGIFMNNSSSLSLESSTLARNSAGTGASGGAIFMNDSPLSEITASTISSNTAGTGEGGGQGGAISANASGSGQTRLSIRASTISGNRADVFGGGIDVGEQAQVDLISSTITDNESGSGGGGVNSGGFVQYKASIVSGNRSGSTRRDCRAPSGGVILSLGFNVAGTDQCPVDLDLQDLQTDAPGLEPLGNNSGPTQTHALIETSPAVDAHNAVDEHCSGIDQRGVPRPQGARCDAGAFELEAPIVQTTIPTKTEDTNDGFCLEDDCSLREAIASASSAAGDDVIPLAGETYVLGLGELVVEGDGDLTLQGPGTIDGGRASRVVRIAAGNTVTLSELTVTGGSSSSGAGIQNSGTLNLNQSTVSGNSAGTSLAGGIANVSDATLNLNRSTVSDNDAGTGGGVVNNGTLTAISSTISGNDATTFFGGGVVNSATATFISSTITDNTATTFGGGISATGATSTTLRASVLAGNTGSDSPDCRGSITSNGYNVLGTSDDCLGFAGTQDLADEDPLLGDLGDNGGPTKTHALDPASPAVDRQPAEGAGCPATDQRGIIRPQGGACDSGAYELEGQAAAPPGQATLDSPRDGGHINPVDFTWQAVEGSTWYFLWINEGLEGGTVAFKQWYTAEDAGCGAGEEVCTVSAPAVFSHGDYRWWVQTWNDAGHGPWSEATVFSLPQVGAATALVSPNGSVPNPVNFTWESVDGSSWYYLWINSGTTGSTEAFKQWYTAEDAGCAGGGTCTIVAPADLEAGDYRWWIQTWNQQGHGPWSEAVRFSVPLPGPATLLSPSEEEASNPVTFTWEQVEGATFYHLWVNDTTGTVFEQWFTSEAAGCAEGTTNCSVLSSAELSAGDHTWWIRTWSPAGHGPWSAGVGFLVS